MVTGACGQLGNVICGAFKDSGCRVIGIDIDINEIKDNMYYEIVNVKKKYQSIKNNFRSPYINNINNYSLYTNYLDSLRILAENLEINRQKLIFCVKKTLNTQKKY